MTDITAFIAEESSKYSNLAGDYQALNSFYENKQYHQLTEKLDTIVKDRSKWSGTNMVDLYKKFINEFKSRINPVSLVDFAVTASKQLYPSRPYVQEELNVAASFLDETQTFLSQGATKNALLGSSESLSANALHLCKSELFLLKVFGENTENGKQALLQELKPRIAALEELRSPEPLVQSSFHRCAAELHRSMGNYGQFYKSCLMYLVFTPTENVANDEGLKLATDLSFAALLGDGIYNFGEIITNNILSLLDGTDKVWLKEMLEIFNNGNIAGFEPLVNKNRQVIESQIENFKEQEQKLKAKLELLSLMELVFRRPAKDRTIGFNEIAKTIQRPVTDVEVIVMRAMSEGLIRGTIDEVDQVLEATWVEPRVLDAPQIKSMVDRLDTWKSSVNETLLFIENQTPEMFKA
jgi:26S proteasome regulatory subunit N9